ncbi:MAG TPA: hypothetical protein VLO10_05650 [Candidatus Deferrimicrobium sp.]|nr:hypothetical protein [Candidatus Deferrimicrobium sp.]
MTDRIDNSGFPGDADLAPPPPPPPPPRRSRRTVIGRKGAAVAVASGLVVGGVAGGYVISQAATSPASASASPSAGSGTAPAHPEPGRDGTEPPHGPGGPGGPGGMRAEDQQVIAGAIGVTTTQLQTELGAGKTIAAIATEHNVTAAKVVSALVDSENSEIDTRVSSGEVTAAQGAQDKTHTQQRATDEVNGTHPDGGPGGPHGAPPNAPAGSPTTG